jgi:hypothetical protein
MKIELKFRTDDARTIEYFLRKRYNSKAKLEKLVMVAIRHEVALEAKKESDGDMLRTGER